MRTLSFWRSAVSGGLVALSLASNVNAGFVESTETVGEIPVDLNGVWMVVSEIHTNPPTPTPVSTPAAGSSGAPAAAASPEPKTSAAPAADVGPRVFSVINLWKIKHIKKPDVEKIKEEEAKRQQASVDKANAIIAKEQTAVPVQTETGDVEGGPKVLVASNDTIVPAPGGDDVDIALLDVTLPKPIEDSLMKAQQSQKAYVPTDKDRALLRSSWATLKPSKRDEFSRIKWKVVAADQFDSGLKTDDKVRGSKFAITGDQQMIPRPSQPSNNIVVYGFSKVSPTEFSGGHVRAMMATAPFPIPIDMKGAFRMYKIADLPKEASAAPKAKPAKDGAAKDGAAK